MKTKHGFTLIELLAVITILALIALISTPIVLNIIEKSKKEAYKDSVYNLIRAVELESITNGANFPITYVVAGNEIFPKVSISGEIDAYGEILIDINGKTKVQVDNGTWCAQKQLEQNQLTLTPSPCTDNPIILGNVKVEPKWTEGLLVNVSAMSQSSTITSYQYVIKKQNEVLFSSEEVTSNQYIFPFDKIFNNDIYQIEVVVKDDQNHIKELSVEYEFSYEPIKTRYLIVEINDSLEGDSVALNELEFLDATNQKLSYTVDAVYDTTTNGNPYYWTDTRYWQKEHLYDEKLSYGSNSEGGATSTLFLYDNSTSIKKGYWARFLVDFGQEKEIKTVNLWTGGSDKRLPHIVKMYSYADQFDENFVQTYIQSKNETLPCVYQKIYNSSYTEPTKDTNYFVFPKTNEYPKIVDIKTSIEAQTLKIEAEIERPFYTPNIKQYRYALIKDNNQLQADDITTWSEFQDTSTMIYDTSTLEEGTYYVYVEVIDNNSNKTLHISQAYQVSKNKIQKQFVIMEVYDHLAVDGAVITELEFYDSNNQKLTYNIPRVYDTVTGGDPTCWNDTLWQKDRLYDSQYHYANNKGGATSSTIVNYPSSANTGMWTRVLIDLGNETTINQLKLWVGGPEGRLAKEIHFYVSNNKDIDTIYNQNIIQRNNNGLVEFATFNFLENIYTVNMLEKNDLKFYTFDKK